MGVLFEASKNAVKAGFSGPGNGALSSGGTGCVALARPLARRGGPSPGRTSPPASAGFRPTQTPPFLHVMQDCPKWSGTLSYGHFFLDYSFPCHRDLIASSVVFSDRIPNAPNILINFL